MSKRKDRVARNRNNLVNSSMERTKKTSFSEVLYHYTCVYHLPAIFSTGYLKLTDSNLIAPDGTWETELRSKSYKPVVWLTDSESPDRLGLDSSAADKKEVKITVARKPYMKYWRVWEPQREMPKWWRDAFTSGYNASSWYVSERVIPFGDILKIENRYDGIVYYESEKLAA